MKKSIKNLIRFISFILVICILTTAASFCLKVADRKDIMHIGGFFLEPEDSLDVALIGASELYTGFCSPLAWNHSGFTSYSLCYAGMLATHYKPAVQEVMAHQNPKLYVIEINGFTCDDEYQNDLTKAHTFLDSVPNDKLRKQLIKDTVPQESQAEFHFPIIKYHENWKYIRSFLVCLRNRIYMALFGQTMTKAYANKKNVLKSDKPKKYTPKPGKIADDSLTDLLEFFKDNNVENVLFVRFPHCVDNKNPEVYENIKNKVLSYGYDYKDFESERQNLNLIPTKDFYHYGHLNVFGQEKFTPVFADYIVSNYDVKSEHSEEITESWNKSWEVTQKVLKATETEEPVEKDINFYYEINGYLLNK